MAPSPPHRFSSRLPWPLDPSPLARALEKRRASGAPVLDLTETNPTRTGLDIDAAEILPALADPASLVYEPDPRGMAAARRAVAAYYAGHGSAVDPDSIFLTAGTSESYALLFKLLADPGDEVLVPRPCYPLFEHLTALENLRARSYPLRLDGAGWKVDAEALAAAAGPRTRAVIAVHPNNPTGSFLRAGDRGRLTSLCAERGAALIVDEVFLDYPAPGFEDAASSLAGEAEALTFVLSGLSKVAALPQLKLGWILVSGPAALASEAAARLEFLTDAYLSVNTPVQLAAGRILAGADRTRARIRDRLARNGASLADACSSVPALRALPREGGWYGVIALPADRDEDETVRDLLDRAGVWVHPGYFYDFEDPALVVSLLLEPENFRAGMARLAGALAG